MAVKRTKKSTKRGSAPSDGGATKPATRRPGKAPAPSTNGDAHDEADEEEADDLDDEDDAVDEVVDDAPSKAGSNGAAPKRRATAQSMAAKQRDISVSEFFAKIAKEQGKTEGEVEQNFITTHRPTSLIGRLATVEDVANLVVYVCSPQASATTGAALRVDGGVIRSIA